MEVRGESRWCARYDGQISVSVNDGEVLRVLTNITPSASSKLWRHCHTVAVSG